jgi:hypothetical protein
MMLLTLIAVLLVLATLPGTIELLALTIASLFHRNPPRASPRHAAAGGRDPGPQRALNIARCVRACRIRDGVDAEIVVIADNCDDDTAELGRAAGARVLSARHERRGKGYALDFAFDAPGGRGLRRIRVIDADSIVSDDFLQVFAVASPPVQMRCRCATPR